MYATINGLLNKSTKALPVLELKTEKELADDFLSFFIAKVEKIRANVDSNVADVVDESSMFHSNQVTSMHNKILIYLDQATLKRSSRIFLVRPVHWTQSPPGLLRTICILCYPF